MKAFAAIAAGFTGAYFCKNSPSTEAASEAFSQSDFQSYKLTQVTQESHNVKRFRFALGDKKTVLNLPVASCITLRYVGEDGKSVMRPYTPTNLPTEVGYFDLVVKEYPNSKMGSHLFKMKVGDTIDAKGPWPTLAVAPSQFSSIGMIAGGTGITPMYQILNHVLNGKGNTTSISLLFGNQTEEDIIMRKDIEALQSKYPKQFAVEHVLSKAGKGWKGATGFVTPELIQKTMPAAKEKNIKVLVSGPPPMMEAICGKKDYSGSPPKQGELAGHLKALGYTADQVYKF